MDNLIVTPIRRRPRIRDRIARRFFTDWQPYPWPEGPVSPNGICLDVTVVLDWKDRLRVLFGGVVKVKTLIIAEHDAGSTQSYSTTYVQRPAMRPRTTGHSHQEVD